MLLYQPSRNEIAAACAVAENRNPHLADQIERAALILENIAGNFDTAPDTWSIRSQSDDSVNWYTVGGSNCTCPDYRHHAAGPKHYYCKHLMAYYGYRRLLANALTRRLVGDYKYTSDRRFAELTPGSVLVMTGEGKPRAITYAVGHRFPRTICHLRLDSNERWVPFTLEDHEALSEWLYNAPAYAGNPEAPRMEDYFPDRQPEMTHDEFQHWMATGDVPALTLPY